MTNFKPMLAHSKSPDPATLKYPVLVQPKIDGIRASVVNGKLVSRTLKAIPNAEIRAALERPEFEGFDGELIVGLPTDTDCYRNTSSYVMSESKTGEPWTFYVFDLWNESGDCATRTDALHRHASCRASDPRVQVVATILAETQDELERMETAMLADGYEGAILRDPAGLYKFGRSGKTGPLLKLKRYVDFEAEIVGVYEEMHNGNAAMTNALGRTERSTAQAGKTGKGTLGGFVLRAINGPAEGVEFRCGTGFDAAQRDAFWKDYHSDGQGGSILGDVVKVKSFPIGVKDKPRHPVFLGFRDMEIDG